MMLQKSFNGGFREEEEEENESDYQGLEHPIDKSVVVCSLSNTAKEKKIVPTYF